MIFYRIGCIVLILTGLIKLTGQFQKFEPKNDTERQLFELAETTKLDVGNGATITVNGTQMGFGLWFSLSLIWAGTVSLFLAKQLGENKTVLRKIAGLNASALLIGSGISLLYFFFIPTICLALALVFFSLATIRLK
jgi:hypothetical protein